MLILASKSATRQTLLRQAGIHFTAIAAEIDERAIEKSSRERQPGKIAQLIAKAKADSVSAIHTDDFIIGADQTLCFEGQILHKPVDMRQARAQLLALRGKTHHLFSAAVLVHQHQLIWQHTSTAQLHMRDFSEAELDHVLAIEGEMLLKSVGAYRMEGASIQLFETIKGDYFTILGLPLLDLLGGLRQHVPQSLSEPS